MTYKTRQKSYMIPNIVALITIIAAGILPRPINFIPSAIGFLIVISIFAYRFFETGFRFTILDNVFKIVHGKNEIEILYQDMMIRDKEDSLVIIDIRHGYEFPIFSDIDKFVEMRTILFQKIKEKQNGMSWLESKMTKQTIGGLDDN